MDIKVIIADDDALIRESLKIILDRTEGIRVIDVAEDGIDALEKCRESLVDVVLLDIRMPQMDGIEAAICMMREGLAKPLLLSTFDEHELIIRALAAGVKGYILKNSPTQRIVSAIRTVYEGGVVFQEDIFNYMRENVKTNEQEDLPTFIEEGFTQREIEIIQLIAKGLSNKQIGEKIFVSEGTVRNYISNILSKTELAHRTQLAIYYLTGKK